MLCTTIVAPSFFPDGVMRKQLWSLFSALLILLALAFWGVALAQNWQQFIRTPWQFSWRLIFLAFVMLVLQIMMAASVLWRALHLAGEKIAWRAGVALYFRAQIARYLPGGGAWEVAGRLTLGQQDGIGKRALAASMGLEMGLHVLSGGIYLLLALGLRSDLNTRAYLFLGGLAVCGAFVFLSPPIFSTFVNWGLRLLKRTPLPFTFTYGDVLLLFLMRLVDHGLLGLAAFLFLSGISPIPLSSAPVIITAYIGAWLIGYLAITIPMGIGVREGIFVLLTDTLLPFSVATAGVVGVRLLIALRDFLAAGVGFWLHRQRSVNL